MKTICLFEKALNETPIVKLSGEYSDNSIFVKRDDLLPFCFGGNKVRKAAEFYKEIKDSQADVVVTYGSNSSNHCRIIANMAKMMGLECHVISPEGNGKILFNTQMVTDFGASIEVCPVQSVSETIEKSLRAYSEKGKKPYFIEGGGHGKPGTNAYVKCYQEILKQEEQLGRKFDYIFHASGTGATQAGLVCGKLLQIIEGEEDNHAIVGISIARTSQRGGDVVKKSVEEYFADDFRPEFLREVTFDDSYRCGGYGIFTTEVENVINDVMSGDGIPMDTTYVGKAFYGMLEYLKANKICGKEVLFIHTGGTPLFFDYLDKH